MTRRFRATLAWDGSAWFGWQRQVGAPTLQQELERVLALIEKAPVVVEASGRTDAGVHAHAQVISFDLQNRIPVENLHRVLNDLLPEDIRVLSVQVAAPDFHARFHARAKTYEYRIWRGSICPPFQRHYVLHFPWPLLETEMIAAAAVYAGDLNFSAFAASDPKDVHGFSKVRRVHSSLLWREGEQLIYRVRGSGFMKHQVRMMVCMLLEVGKGNLSKEELAARLQPPYAPKACAVPARGLHLLSVEYDD
jgi:tRNA pseudouridine38-40 synthase